MKRMIPVALLAVVLTLPGQDSLLKMEQVMTAEEWQQTGVSTLSPAQRAALDRWLVSYTTRVLSAQAQAAQKPASAPVAGGSRSSCAPAIESTISGEFNGWSGDTIFKLDNGQIWQQAAYDYTYSYSYRPDVTIYQTASGCKMKVEDEDDTILVKRLK